MNMENIIDKDFSGCDVWKMNSDLRRFAGNT